MPDQQNMGNGGLIPVQQYQNQQYQGTPASVYQQAPVYAPMSSMPRQAPENGFILNIVGLVLSFLQLCIPGLICNIIGFVKADRAKTTMVEELPGDNTGNSWVIGLIGIIVGSLMLILQVILCVIFGAILIAAINNPTSGINGTGESVDDVFLDGGSSSTDIQTVGLDDIDHIEMDGYRLSGYEAADDVSRYVGSYT